MKLGINSSNFHFPKNKLKVNMHCFCFTITPIQNRLKANDLFAFIQTDFLLKNENPWVSPVYWLIYALISTIIERESLQSLVNIVVYVDCSDLTSNCSSTQRKFWFNHGLPRFKLWDEWIITRSMPHCYNFISYWSLCGIFKTKFVVSM